MDPWRVDAAEVDLSLEEIQNSDLILKTVQIERFLGPDHRNTIAVVGPKGLGKTLVVKARRLISQSDSIGMIPRNGLVDNPLIKWVGEKTYLLEHVTTGEIERIDNYVIRHSFGRPRDLMVLGGAIANIGADRRTPLMVKSAVNSAAARLVLTYVEECRLHVPQIDIDLATDVIDRNVIQTDRVSSINDAYRQRFQNEHGKALVMDRGILDYLFQIGLIGYVGRPVPGGPQSQIFQLPGSIVSRSAQRLPTAEAYLVHPALSDLVALRKGEQYTKNLNRFNIIGHGVSWRRPSDGYFVLNADIAKFSSIMTAGVEYPTFVKRYEELVRNAGAKCHHAEVTEGDRTIIIDQNAARAIDAAREIIASVQSILPRQTAIRFGGDFGVVVFEESVGRRKPLGAPLRGSGRLEAKAGVGKCLVSELFITYAGDKMRAFFNDGVEINMSKDNEPPEYVKAFEGLVELTIS